MFIGRESELQVLDRMYKRPGFQMAVIYGRRRVGKTALIDRFVRDKPALYFTAQQKSSMLNLTAFSSAIHEFFGDPQGSTSFVSWDAALSYVARRSSEFSSSHDKPMVVVFDEFPYAAETEPALPSALQIAIDHEFSSGQTKMVLCGSNEGFMESEVLGRKSPLYGRRTMQLRVRPFDYLDTARMLPGISHEELVTYYATFGGTPYYLSQIDPAAGYETNVRELAFNTSGLLYEEPIMLLREELREPALYNSVLDAIGGGATSSTRIAEKAGVGVSSISKYLKTLLELGLVRRVVPFGANPASSKRGLYEFEDPFFSYWYHFVSKYVGLIEAGLGEGAARRASGVELSTYVGKIFEQVCMQWVYRQVRKGEFPFLPTSFGRWWGTDPSLREQVDIDLIAADPETRTALFGECKWRESLNETEAIATLEHRSALIRGFDRRTYALFTKHPTSEATRAKASQRDDLTLITLTDLFEDL